MKVEQNNKTLYHIQNLEIGSDGQPFDTYIWCDHFPNKQDLRRAFDLEWGENALMGWNKTTTHLTKCYLK